MQTRICNRFPLVSAGFLMLFAAIAFTPATLFADGCFVKFVWDKDRDIKEPTQKAIIAYNAGREDLLLQVKYEGPLEEFGWLIPVPNLPTVTQGTMECFYELSEFTQRHFDHAFGMANLSRAGGEEPPVKVLQVKTVGAYNVTTLEAKDAGALEHWLGTNKFSLPADAAPVLDAYISRHWYFIAVKINLKNRSRNSLSEQLANGELHPLQISFTSDRCVFPLKISSLNHSQAEVQLYVLSPEALVEKTILKEKMAEYATEQTQAAAQMEKMRKERQEMIAQRLARRSRAIRPPPPIEELNEYDLMEVGEALVQYTSVTAGDLPITGKRMGLFKKQKACWLTKVTRTFQPDEMRDLEFEPALPIFKAALMEPQGACAAKSLAQLGSEGAAVLLAAMQNPDPAIRARATSVAEQMYTIQRTTKRSAKEDDEDDNPPYRHLIMNPDVVKLLPTLLNDTDSRVRAHAIFAAMNCPNPKLTPRMMELLRDENARVSSAAVSYLSGQPEELQQNVPLLRRMLKDSNVNVQKAALHTLIGSSIEIPREEILPLFNAPRVDVAAGAMGYLKHDTITCDEARPLLSNSVWTVRMMGLGVLIQRTNSQSIEYAIPLLKDHEDIVRMRAHDLLMDLTEQTFPLDQPEQWEKWWDQNKSTFKVNVSPEDMQRKRIERLRQRRSEMNREAGSGSGEN